MRCPACGGTIYGSGVAKPGENPHKGAFEDRRAMCYQCGASYTITYRAGKYVEGTDKNGNKF